MLLVVIVLGFLFLFIFVFFLLFLADSIFGGLDFASGSSVASKVIEVVKERHLETGNFYDLGSARGGFAVKIAQALPKMHIIGIDDSRFRVLLSKARAVFFKNLKFKKENIFTTDVSSANIIYLYLPQELMPELQTKLQKELKPGALVISTSVSFPSWQPIQVYDLDQKGLKVPKLFIYAKE